MRLFVAIERQQQRRRRKVTPAGLLVLTLLVACAVFGINTQQVQVYQLFALVLVLLLLAVLGSWRFRPQLRVRRALPAYISAGQAFEYQLHVHNHGQHDYHDLWLHDTLITHYPSAAQWRTPDSHDLNAVDRRLGHWRWLRWVQRQRGARLLAQEAVSVPAGGSVSVTLRGVALRRGTLEFAGVWLGRAEPLGLLRGLHYLALPDTLLALPQRHATALPSMAGQRRLQPGGVAFAGHVGDAEEFAGVRDFRPGDSPRRMHWKAWARTGQLVVKEYQEEFFVRQALILDNFTADAALFEAAVSAAASLVTAERAQDSLLDLMLVEDQAYTLTQGRGVGGVDAMLRVLAVVQAAAHHDFDRLAQSVRARASVLSGAVCLFLARDTLREQLVADLRAQGVAVQVWLFAATGSEPELPHGWRRLRPDHLAEDLRP